MRYSVEDIYRLVGSEDKVTGLTFRNGSESHERYGDFITVVFTYTQKEREELDKELGDGNNNTSGRIKARVLVEKLTETQIKQLETEGVLSDDIVEILYFTAPEKNTFHSKAKRKIDKIEIQTSPLPKGRDYDWMYGFKKQLEIEGIGMCPAERNFYLAGKYYYEPDNLTESEVEEIYQGSSSMSDSVEWELLSIKYFREEIRTEEKTRLGELIGKRKKKHYEILDYYLTQAGSSLKKLAKENIEQAVDLFMKVSDFKERRLNVTGKKPVYIDLDSYLHIYMRHVEELKVTDHFEDKDNFQWDEEDVFSVMRHVIEETNEEIQKHFEKSPDRRYSRYGKESAYYQGDYYTFHIEPTGRVSTFHKNRKEHEKASR
jgi:hypothetical protein